MDTHSIDTIDNDMVLIYQLLNFEDQVRLASTSLRKRNIFVNDVWKQKYRTLHIYPFEESLIVTAEAQVNKEIISTDVLEEFLKLYAEQIHDLKLFTLVDIDLRQFKNLTKLHYQCSKEPLKDLQMIAKDVPNLECLEFPHNPYSPFAWNKEHLMKMKNLKRLSLFGCMTYRTFRELITKLKLEYFETPHLIPDERVIKSEQGVSEARQHLKELDIICNVDPQKWGNNLSSFLKHFENISTLTLHTSDVLNQEILTKLSESCKNLEKLTFYLTSFRDIQSFSVGPKLTDLTLTKCDGLTFANLKQLLTGTSITKFSTKGTGYSGECEEFHLSPLIQTLEICFGQINELKLLLAGNKNLKELTLYSMEKRLNMAWGSAIKSCINLETLSVGEMPLAADDIMQLKNLHTLYVSCFHQIGGGLASFITTLLKHPNLNNLIVYCYDIDPIDVHTIRSLEGFSTNITNLNIHADVFKSCMDFWLDLFSRNYKMKLCIAFFNVREIDFLRELVICERFPKSLRTIDVGGFTINCNDLRIHPDLTIQKLQRYIKDFDEPYHIILCKPPLPQNPN